MFDDHSHLGVHVIFLADITWHQERLKLAGIFGITSRRNSQGPRVFTPLAVTSVVDSDITAELCQIHRNGLTNTRGRSGNERRFAGKILHS